MYMSNIIIDYIARRYRSRQEAVEPPTLFERWALEKLTRSRAYKSADAAAVVDLATALQSENDASIRVARAYPDVYDAGVIRAAEAENGIYASVIQRAARGAQP